MNCFYIAAGRLPLGGKSGLTRILIRPLREKKPDPTQKSRRTGSTLISPYIRYYNFRFRVSKYGAESEQYYPDILSQPCSL